MQVNSCKGIFDISVEREKNVLGKEQYSFFFFFFGRAEKAALHSSLFFVGQVPSLEYQYFF